MSTPAEKLLSHLDGVRERTRGRWSARCPAHDDRSPSLSIAERDDGALLLRCWSGCEVADVVAAVGLDLRDLFPEREPGQQPPKRRPWMAADLLRLAAYESMICSIVASDLKRDVPVSDADWSRLKEAAARLLDIAEAATS